MFTGIVQNTTNVLEIQTFEADRRMRIALPVEQQNKIDLGDSISLNGVCLTVSAHSKDDFWVDLSAETLLRTTAQDWLVDQAVNMETALTPNSLMGGHIVSGHVDGVAILVSTKSVGRATSLRFQAPADLQKYLVKKGSVCLDGVSLTVNASEESRFDVALIPHTLEATASKHYQVGTRVNLEVDIIARYLERLMRDRN